MSASIGGGPKKSDFSGRGGVPDFVRLLKKNVQKSPFLRPHGRCWRELLSTFVEIPSGMNLYSCLRSELCPPTPKLLYFPHSNDRKALKKLTPPPRKKRYILIPWEPRIRYLLILRDPVVSGIRYFFIPRDPVVPCVVVVVHPSSPGFAIFLFPAIP